MSSVLKRRALLAQRSSSRSPSLCPDPGSFFQMRSFDRDRNHLTRFGFYLGRNHGQNILQPRCFRRPVQDCRIFAVQVYAAEKRRTDAFFDTHRMGTHYCPWQSISACADGKLGKSARSQASVLASVST